ncbi:hypothetical protein BDR07DRAFT_1438170 [Suillus spraguei]|nr:hypothetical protein BDR07DRAFT_1438170 [Suillus spraguei]
MRTFKRRQSPTPADVITYRLNNRMVYVPQPRTSTLAQLFQQAVTFARSAFEGDLTGIDKSRISFSLNVLANGKKSSVNISREAWSTIMSHLVQYEIVDVHVQPELRLSGPPPSYQSCDSTKKQQHLSSQSSSYAGLSTSVERVE